MKTALFILIAIFMMATVSFGWTTWQWMGGGASSTSNDYPQRFTSDGGLYKTKGDANLYYVPYSGGVWGSEQPTSGLGTIACATISPDRKSGFIADNGRVYPISSTDGINWTKGSELTAWYQAGNPIGDITCEWSHPDKYLIGNYSDGYSKYAPSSNYNNPQTINFDPTGDGKTVCVDVRDQGDRAIICDSNAGQFDFYESTSSDGITWTGKTAIAEVNTSGDEVSPVIAAFGGSIRCAGCRYREGYNADPFWSTDGSNSDVESTSLGKVKAIFR